jgi:hypothetical protein
MKKRSNKSAMAQIRKVKGFGWRYLLGNLAYVIPMGFCLWVLWRSFSTASFGIGFWLGMAGFVICLILGIYLDVLRLRRFRCPECHARLPWQPPKPGERWLYFCAKCDIIWDTGLIKPDD